MKIIQFIKSSQVKRKMHRLNNINKFHLVNSVEKVFVFSQYKFNIENTQYLVIILLLRFLYNNNRLTWNA